MKIRLVLLILSFLFSPLFSSESNVINIEDLSYKQRLNVLQDFTNEYLWVQSGTNLQYLFFFKSKSATYRSLYISQYGLMESEEISAVKIDQFMLADSPHKAFGFHRIWRMRYNLWKIEKQDLIYGVRIGLNVVNLLGSTAYFYYCVFTKSLKNDWEHFLVSNLSGGYSYFFLLQSFYTHDYQPTIKPFDAAKANTYLNNLLYGSAPEEITGQVERFE